MRWAYEEGIEYGKSDPDEQLCGFLELPWHVFKEVIEKLYLGRIPPTRRTKEGLDGEHIFLIHSPYPPQQRKMFSGEGKRGKERKEAKMEISGRKKLKLIKGGNGEIRKLEFCRVCSKFKVCEEAKKPDQIPLPRLCNDGLVQLAMKAEEKREKKKPIRAYVEVCDSGSVHVWIDAILANGEVMRINGGSVASKADDKKITKKINQVLSRCVILPGASARKDYVRFGKPSFMRS